MTYISRFLHLVEKERIAEIDRQTKEITHQTAEERQNLGRCDFPFKGKKAGRLFQYPIIKFIKPNNLRAKIGVGNLVLLSRGDPLSSDTTGTVHEVGNNFLTIAFDAPPPKWVFQAGIRIDLYSNDIPYKRMQENLNWFARIKHPLKNLILGEGPAYMPKPVPFIPYSDRLNISQKKAIESALGAHDFFLIHGPPGTGKTTTLGELIFQATLRKKRVLASAESNIAADNILAKLSTYPDLKIVRLGHPARICPGFEAYSLYAHLEHHPLFNKYKGALSEVEVYREKQKKYQKPIDRYRRGMDDDKIIKLARKGRGGKGVRGRTVASMYGWIKQEQKIQNKWQSAQALRAEMIEDIIGKADVIVCTNSVAGSDLLTSQYFDLAVIDEGSQQVEPSSLIPILKARRFIMAGDDKQLPPTIISPEAQELQKTLFARLKAQYPDNVKMLCVQYRMNDQILNFSRNNFYSPALVSDPSVHNHTLSDLLLQTPVFSSAVLDPARPVVFFDTSAQLTLPLDLDIYESRNKKQTSFENHFEAEKIDQMVQELLTAGLTPDQIGVISPYSAQVQLLKKKMLGHDCEIASIDGFQGREKEVILISMVRANAEGSIGFLNDLRRLNVAITRARRKLIIVGHGDTLKTNDVYAQWLAGIMYY